MRNWIYDLRFAIYDWIWELVDLGNGLAGRQHLPAFARKSGF